MAANFIFSGQRIKIDRAKLAADEIDVYCIEGKKLRSGEVRIVFKNRHFEERFLQSVGFAVMDDKSALIYFRELAVMNYYAGHRFIGTCPGTHCRCH